MDKSNVTFDSEYIILGEIPEIPSVVITFWARRILPKPGHVKLIESALHITSGDASRCYIIIDDFIPQFLENRSSDFQNTITTAYVDFYREVGAQNIILVSELQILDSFTFASILHLMKRISLTRLLSILPNRTNYNSIEISDIIHTVFHLLTLEHAERFANCWLTGLNSIKFASLYRTISSNPMCVIALEGK